MGMDMGYANIFELSIKVAGFQKMVERSGEIPKRLEFPFSQYKPDEK
jgi:hypothetical protein